jgi:hypothetical protein
LRAVLAKLAINPTNWLSVIIISSPIIEILTFIKVKSYLRRQADEMTANAKNTQWVWNVDAVDIDDATGEIRRLEKQVRMLLIQPL